MNDVQVGAPGGFVPQIALTLGARDGVAVAVDRTNPLPMRAVATAAASVPLAGTLAESGVVGPFTPELMRAITVTLAGEWSGTVSVLRSSDGGATRAQWAGLAARLGREASNARMLDRYEAVLAPLAWAG